MLCNLRPARRSEAACPLREGADTGDLTDKDMTKGQEKSRALKRPGFSFSVRESKPLPGGQDIDTHSRLIWIASPDEAPGEESDEAPKLSYANQRFAASLISDRHSSLRFAGCLLMYRVST